MKKIAVVIINFNGEKNTLECLHSLNNLLTGKYSLLTVVVDNGSIKQFSAHDFQSSIGQIKVIRSEKNLGFAGGNNLGIKYSLQQDAEYVLILNNDTIIDKHLIIKSVDALSKDKKVGIVAPKIYFAKGFEFHKDRYKDRDLGKVIWYAGGIMDWQNIIGYHRGVDEVDNGQYNKTEITDFASGCCMLIKSEIIENIGLFDEKYFLYYEDGDLSERVKKAGYKIFYEPKAVLWHKNAGSTGGSGSDLQDYFITRNRLLFGMTYAPFKSKLALIKESFKLLIKGRFWQKRGVVDYYLGKFGKGSYPLRD